MEIGLAGLVAALFALAFARDPRTMRCAVLLLGAVSALLVRFVGLIITAIAEQSGQAAAWALLGLLIVIALLLVVLAVMLVLNGVTMLRREGRRLSNLLSLALGVAVLAAVVTGGLVLASGSSQLLVLLLLASLPPGFLAFGFVAYLLYSPLYQAYARGLRRTVDAVVVLGSGLINGAVPPLLAGRLDRARRVYDTVLEAGRNPLVVTSGGQGADEPRAEAVAMAEYLRDEVLAGRDWEDLRTEAAILAVDLNHPVTLVLGEREDPILALFVRQPVRPETIHWMPVSESPRCCWMVGTEIETIVWSMKVIDTAKIIAARTREPLFLSGIAGKNTQAVPGNPKVDSRQL